MELWLRLHRPDPSHRAFGYCSCKQDTKERYAGQQFVQMERNISFRPVKMDHTPSNSGRTKPKWSIPLDVPTEISGILGRLESAQWITGKRVSNFPSPDWHIGDSFFNFSIIVRSQILVNIFNLSPEHFFGTVSQTDLTRRLFPSVSQAAELFVVRF